MSISWNIEVCESVSSTQDFLRAKSGLGEGDGVRAEAQSGGRGRHGREWESARGNLAFSFILEPDCAARYIGLLALLCGVAVHDAVSEVVAESAEVMVKWPNDVLIDGLKCAGILLESELDARGNIARVICGIGVNIASAPQGAGALASYGAGGVSPAVLSGAILSRVAALYALFQSGDYEAITDQWRRRAHPAGTPMSVKLGADVLHGTFHSLDEFGNLSLCIGPNEYKTITAGDVFIGRPAKREYAVSD